MNNKWLEPAVEAYKKYFGNTANIIIDIGTRDGDDAEYFREKLDGKEVYAFDANPIAIEETKSRYPDFVVIERAVSNYDGTTKFSQILSEDKDLAGCSSIVRIHDVHGRGATAEIEVPVLRMDTFIKSIGLNKIDIVKVDTEGFSFEVIDGFGEHIHNVKLFHLETETFNRHDGHKNNLEVKSFMESKGFELVDLSYQWGPTIEDQVWINHNLIGLDK